MKDPMLGVIKPGRLELFRRIGGRNVAWRVVEGDEATLQRAVEAARFLSVAAEEVGGWANALRLGLDPAEPVDRWGLVVPLFTEHSLDRGLGELEVASSPNGPGPRRVDVDRESGVIRILADELGQGDAEGAR